VIRDRHRSVADPTGEKFGEERTDRPVDHANIDDENGDNDDRNRIIDIARLRDRSEPAVQGIVGERREHEARQYSGLRPMWSDSQPKRMGVGVPMISPAPTI